TLTWNEELLSSLFESFDVQTVLKIRPSHTRVRDSLFWIHSNHGWYTIKTGYSVLRNLHREQSSSLAHHNVTMPWFKTLWQLNIPPKIKCFWWRVILNSLHVAFQLCKGNIHVDDTCQFCGQEPETLNHLPFGCNISKEIWNHVTDTDTQFISETPKRYPEALSLPQLCYRALAYCCFVATSWTSSTQESGIAWMLYTKEAKPILQGSAFIGSVQTPIAAEVIALKMAMQEVNKLNYPTVVSAELILVCISYLVKGKKKQML
ncbi:unnamed protein product, partial [Thlaspi arvense]